MWKPIYGFNNSKHPLVISYIVFDFINGKGVSLRPYSVIKPLPPLYRKLNDIDFITNIIKRVANYTVMIIDLMNLFFGWKYLYESI